MNRTDPADYGVFPGDAEFIRGLPEHERLIGYPADQRIGRAKQDGIIHDRTHGIRRLVELPAEDVPLGSTWVALMTNEQVTEAHSRGMLSHLAAGVDVDTAAPADAPSTSPDAGGTP